MDDREREHLEGLLRILRQRFNVVEKQITMYGDLHVPAYLPIELQEVNVKIAQTEKQLQDLILNPPPRPRAPSWILPIGAKSDAHGTSFRVWAADARRVHVVLYEDDNTPLPTIHELRRQLNGYFEGYISGVLPGRRYKYRLDEGDAYPDPASRYQPDGVHGPSQVVDPTVFDWTDQDWRGITLEDLLIYELHVGTATPEGTFDALITRLGAIRELGATAIELMPVADFPGERNWGYDGVCLFAPSRAYGGPEGLRRLVDAAHARGLAVILDTVFNHLGPEGNYLGKFSKAYFSAEDFKTPWGEAMDFVRKRGRSVRDFFVWNAQYWAHEYHIDGLRLDAIQAMHDSSEPHILREITSGVRSHLPENRAFLILAEDEKNDPKVVESFNERGFGIDALWSDDFHHQVHVALTGEQHRYYENYTGSIADLVTTVRQGWFYTGERSAHAAQEGGELAMSIPPTQFVYFIQNHDQVGNRAYGDRLDRTISLDAYRAASALLILSPYTPLLWMGQEWAASTPFLYFTDRNLEPNQSVLEERRREFTDDPTFANDDILDPQNRATFLNSKLSWNERAQAPHAGILRLYRKLIEFRRQLPALKRRDREAFAVTALGEGALALRRDGPEQKDTLLVIVNLRNQLKLNLQRHPETRPPAGFTWTPLLDTEDAEYGGRRDTQLVEGITLEMTGPAALLLALSSQ